MRDDRPRPRRRGRRHRGRARRLTLVLALAAALVAAAAARAAPLTVLAYYYPWFAPDGARWHAGYVRAGVDPPLLGEYVSSDPAVVDRHFAWAHEYGIGAFVCSWDGAGSFSDRTLAGSLFPSPARGSTQLAVLYESLARFPLGGDARIHLDADGVARLVGDFDYLARTYFSEPGYLRVDGRPVVVIYASRIFRGPFAEAIAAIRADVESVTGVDPYLIGDEVDWDNPPDPARIGLFDAITGYTPYSRTQAATLTGAAFLAAVRERTALFAAVARSEGVAFVPDAIPGYDDLGERPAEAHHVLPRELGGDPAGLFSGELAQASGLVDRRLGLLAVTSFDEWGEDTQIEPTAGYGTTFLERLRDFATRWDTAPLPRGAPPVAR
ncbi:MAG TPA: glycoside hydrolase family 99-like domain-containing protein [Gaiellaceae bacterium]|nr:glycoside hydrolase family 99-like domain-containing protein [Gaiellaceae bacterium]